MKSIFKRSAAALLSALVLYVCPFSSAARADDSGDNFGSLSDLIVSNEKLTIKSGSKLVLDDDFLTISSQEPTAAEVISEFENKNVTVTDKDGKTLSESETVTTACVIKLADGKDVIDSRVIVVKGDVNCDGTADSSDATLILKYDAGLISLSGAQNAAADVSGDEETDSSDATLILKLDAGLITEL